MKLCRWLVATVACLLLLFSCAVAETTDEAKDLTRKCTIIVSADKSHKDNMFTMGNRQSWTATSGSTVTVKGPKDGSLIQGISVSFLGTVPTITITADEETVAFSSMDYKNQYIAFSQPVASFEMTLDCVDPEQTLALNHLYIYGEGELPDSVQQWTELEDSADIMVIATHPDDELLWFGGLLPTYAGELQKKVIVVYFCPSKEWRKNELLNGLWTCGVRYYPVLGSFHDDGRKSDMDWAMENWGEEAMESFITEAIRKYKPSVVITQDMAGEYGHGAHKAAVKVVTDVITSKTMDASFDTASAEAYGTWTVKKLYLHLWQEGEITMDWDQPLSFFGGETGYSVALRAYKLHYSQQKGKHHMLEYGDYDCRKFGLYWTTVGPDEAGNDFLEHIE